MELLLLTALCLIKQLINVIPISRGKRERQREKTCLRGNLFHVKYGFKGLSRSLLFLCTMIKENGNDSLIIVIIITIIIITRIWSGFLPISLSLFPPWLFFLRSCAIILSFSSFVTGSTYNACSCSISISKNWDGACSWFSGR